MSFRDLRSFTEMMRALGYPRLISMENFRSPNFPLVAEILIWLVHRYDPNADLPTDIDTANDRVLVIKAVAHFMATKANIKLNTKRLYQADGHAVKELLKVTSILYTSMKGNIIGSLDKPDRDMAYLTFDISSRISELKEARSLATEITAKGATLYDHLSKEVDMRELRSQVIARPMEIEEVDRGLQASIKSAEDDIKKTTGMLENVASDEVNLDAKIDKKRNELERNQKRLQTLKSVRPAYMDEYERLEEDLQKLYDTYLNKFRNLCYLEQQVDEYQRIENDKLEETDEALRNLAEKLKSEETVQISAADFDDFAGDLKGDDDDGTNDENDRPLQPMERPVHHRIRPAAAAPGKTRLVGSMTGDLSEEEEDTETGASDDSEIGLEGKDSVDDNSEDEIDVNHIEHPRNAPVTQPFEDSDNDF